MKQDMKEITEDEAFNLYLEKDYDKVCPFQSMLEYDFLTLLKSKGYTVIPSED